MSMNGKKRYGTNKILEMAKSAERGVSGQKKQEIFAAYEKAREELLSGPADAVPQAEKSAESAEAKSQILMMSALCKRAAIAAAAIAVCGLLLFAVGRTLKRPPEPDNATVKNVDTAIEEQFTTVVIDDAEGKTAPEIMRPDEKKDSMLMSGFTFDSVQDMSMDRVSMTVPWILRPYQTAEWDGEAQALCLVTVQNIDFSQVNAGQGTHVPITIRIDRIFHSTSGFDLVENASIVTQDSSVWFAAETGYSLHHPQEDVPVTEVGAQYIVTVTKSGDGARYRVAAHTIPIDGQSRVISGDYGPLVWGTVQLGSGKRVLLPREELYKKMALGDDVVDCSEELIRMYVETSEGS